MFNFPPEMMQHLMQFIQQQYGPQYAQQFQAMATQQSPDNSVAQPGMPQQQQPNYNAPPMQRPPSPLMGPDTSSPMSNYGPYNPGGTPMGPNQNTPTPAAAPAPSAWSTALANTPSLFGNSAGLGVRGPDTSVQQTGSMGMPNFGAPPLARPGAGLSNLSAAPGTQWRGFGA